ncbi:MAG: hypothetical protein AAF765_07645 [Bacteroidota bacterium]
MKKAGRITALFAALAFTIIGSLQINAFEKPIFAISSFLVAVVFLYQFLGTQVLPSRSFSTIQNKSKEIVFGKGDFKLMPNRELQVVFITFLALLVFFTLGFGMGKFAYHIVH